MVQKVGLARPPDRERNDNSGSHSPRETSKIAAQSLFEGRTNILRRHPDPAFGIRRGHLAVVVATDGV
jgi:hypothetical protein